MNLHLVRWLAWGTCGVCVVLNVAGPVLSVTNASTAGSRLIAASSRHAGAVENSASGEYTLS